MTQFPALTYLFMSLSYTIPILIAVAILKLVEWKNLSNMQAQKGPKIVKLFIKEPIRPSTSSLFLFIMTPMLTLLLAITIWIPLPLPFSLTSLNLGLQFLLAMSCLVVYSILWSGWSSNSKYVLIGALWAVVQTSLYEVTLAIILLSIIMLSSNYTLKTLTTT